MQSLDLILGSKERAHRDYETKKAMEQSRLRQQMHASDSLNSFSNIIHDATLYPPYAGGGVYRLDYIDDVMDLSMKM